MMKRILFLLFVFVISTAYSQEKVDTTYWKKGGNFNLNFTQISFTNWAAGGLNSVTGVAKMQLFMNYHKDNLSWDNIINLGFGISKVQGIAIKKSDDIIDLTSKLGLKATNKLLYSCLLNFNSQFAPGYSDLENEVKISNFLAPAYATVALGIDYKPNKKWSFVVAPLSGKLTLVNDPDLEGNYGVKPGHIARIEMGALVNVSVNTELVKNVDLISDITLFSNYLYHPEKIDVNWKVAVNMKINDYLSALVNTQLIYDADIIDPVYNVAKVQFKELFGVGLNFKF